MAQRFGFEEYDAPLLESEVGYPPLPSSSPSLDRRHDRLQELYVRKAGEEVTQQLYNFEDKSGRRMALRPEMTPSLARMVGWLVG